MRQLTQKLRHGKLAVLEVPSPLVGPGQVLVRNHYSVISAGTEASTVSAARKSLVGKAKERPAQLKQVLDVLASQGPVQTWRAVAKKLEAHSPLGYSSAGEVVAVGAGAKGFRVGDLAACAGAGYANHAELVAVPVNLCVKLAPGADLRSAAYNTLAAIALQGIRQADLRLGESAVVIGLGLIGQLTALMLRAGGIQVLGLDISKAMVELARAHCCDQAWALERPEVEAAIAEATGGIGADAVIITAGTSSLEPINLAGRVARQKGRVVVVGAVPTGFERAPYYVKELELRMSCSYGPGRYDPAYEEHGIDYPVGYVRWTQKRNMAAFQGLVHGKRIDLGYLTTHEVALEDAPAAYDMILARSEPFLGVVIRYPFAARTERPRVVSGPRKPAGEVNIGFVGAGSYALSHLLPNIGGRGVRLRGVLTNTGTSSRSVADRYGFEFCTAEEGEIFDNPEINTVFVATRHDSHARYVARALRAGKHVFVEKPLALNREELDELVKLRAQLVAQGGAVPVLTVGFNRRFSPLTRRLKEELGEGPCAMTYRINAGSIQPTSWVQDTRIGGGRIIGEACHFIDLLSFLAGAMPTTVFANAMSDARGMGDTVAVNLGFDNGSVGSIVYCANGPRTLFKEQVEIFRQGMSGTIRDFRELELHVGAKPRSHRLLVQDKGQENLVARFLESVADGGPAPIPADELFAVSGATLGVVESLRLGSHLALGQPEEREQDGR